MPISKKYQLNDKRKQVAQVLAEAGKSQFSVVEAGELLPKLSFAGFTGTANIDFILNLKDENATVRGSVTFPNQFGESKRVLVFAEGENAEIAKKAGADHAGLDELVEKIDGGWVEFDVAIATPDLMPKIAKLGKVLGPRQLMPNPKTGTVTEDLEKAVKMYKSGKVDFKLDPGKTIKLAFAKLDMSSEQISANLETIITAVKAELRSHGVNPIRSIIVSPTMGPGINVKI